MQNVSVEEGVRQIRAVEHVFHSRTDVRIFYLIIFNVGQHIISSLERLCMKV